LEDCELNEEASEKRKPVLSAYLGLIFTSVAKLLPDDSLGFYFSLSLLILQIFLPFLRNINTNISPPNIVDRGYLQIMFGNQTQK
jgi:hypothetical protein